MVLVVLQVAKRVMVSDPQGLPTSTAKGSDMDLSSILDAITGIERRRELEQRQALLCSLGAVSVAEVYSPPRVTARAQFHGLEGGVALDLTVLNDHGKPWDFSLEENRKAARNLIADTQPYLLVGSPPCAFTAASSELA